MKAGKSPVQTWLQLFRAPNLFTVPGDPLAGFLLASGGVLDARLATAILASICFYAHGLLLNDLADLAEDRRDRPERPLPSGAVPIRTVQVVAAALAGAALLLCALASWAAFGVGCALLIAVAVYNLWSKKFAALGPLNMGLCRGFSLLLGAAAAAPLSTLPPLVFLAAGSLTLYIALVTFLARIETHAAPPLLPRTLPFVGLIIAVVPFFFSALDSRAPLGANNLLLYAVAAYALYAGFKIHRRLTRSPAPPIPPIIGQLIRLLLPLQALWCLGSHSSAGIVAAAVLLVLWPVSRAVSRRFYAS